MAKENTKFEKIHHANHIGGFYQSLSTSGLRPKGERGQAILVAY